MTQHLSKSYDTALDTVLRHFLQMGKLANAQLAKMTTALVSHDKITAQAVIDADKEINAFERTIDEHLVALIAQRQPTASDLRFIIAMSKAVVDLERIGDETVKMARFVLNSPQAMMDFANAHEIAQNIEAQYHRLSQSLYDSGEDTLNAFKNKDVNLAMAVIEKDRDIDKACTELLASLTAKQVDSQLLQMQVVVLRAFERIGDHLKNIAEHTIYWVLGEDIRHLGVTRLEQLNHQNQL